MPVPFKKDPAKYNQRTLLATNVFDLLDKDDDCFIYEDIFSQIDTAELEKKYSMIDASMHTIQGLLQQYLYMLTARAYLVPER
jgi:hypothetical protein